MDALRFFLKGKMTGNERVGFILKSGEVVEVHNDSSSPIEGFSVSAESLLQYDGQVAATWHTHPGVSANLSAADYESFMNYPEWDHYIAGIDGIRRYFLEGGCLLQSE